MSYSADRTTTGFEWLYNLAGHAPNPVPYELKPDTEFKKGVLVVVDDGLVEPADNTTNITEDVLGVMAEEIKQADNPSDKVTYGRVYTNPLDVFRVSVTGQNDVTADGGSSTVFETASNIHDDLKGATMYVYEGDAKGTVRTISAVADDNATVYEEFPEDIESGDKAVIIGFDDTNGAFWPGMSGVFADSDGLKANVGKAADNGPLHIVKIDAINLMVDVLVVKA